MKDGHRMVHNHLVHATGDAVNGVLAAGYSFRRLLLWVPILVACIAHALNEDPRRQLGRSGKLCRSLSTFGPRSISQ